MSMHKPAQFTPGPWTQDGLFIVAENGDVSVPICDCDVENFLDEAQANANLIAAAPAMYEALKLALAWSMDGTPDSELSPIELGMRQAVEAALAQAEGRQGR